MQAGLRLVSLSGHSTYVVFEISGNGRALGCLDHAHEALTAERNKGCEVNQPLDPRGDVRLGSDEGSHSVCPDNAGIRVHHDNHILILQLGEDILEGVSVRLEGSRRRGGVQASWVHSNGGVACVSEGLDESVVAGGGVPGPGDQDECWFHGRREWVRGEEQEGQPGPWLQAGYIVTAC